MSAGKPTPSRLGLHGETCTCGEPAKVVWLTDDQGPVPFCGDMHPAQRRADCPPWCVEEHHAPFDKEHASKIYGVELDAHPYQVQCPGGKWETWRHSILAAVAKDSADMPAYIEMTGQNDQAVSRMTAGEADQLAGILRRLAATLRGARHDLVTAQEDAR